ncbi:hypothetical protein KEM55_003611 [Ascosphaera atra]|nr:hypothetical protein KEM55_003611 [Ascosphaera atra]
MAALGTLTSMLAWAMPQAVEMARAVPNAFAAAATQDEDAVLGALDMLHALYGRTGSSISPTLIGQIFAPEQVQFLQQLYQWSIVGPDDAGELKYTISKKISELAAYLCSYLEFGDYKISGASMTSFFGFLVDILLHPSLVVSIPILHAFSRILAIDWIANDAIVTTILGPVLEVCTTRMVRYEALPEDAEDPTVVFLNEDIDTPQEKHAFVSNYRKYCTALIDLTVQIRPEEAVSHLLSKVDLQLSKCYEGVEPFGPVKCRKWSVPLVRADTQFCVVEGLLKGFRKWADALGSRPQEDEQRRVILEKAIESWGRSLMERQFDDPHIKQRVLRLSVDISAKALSDKPQFALKVLEHIMVSFVPERPEFPSYSEAVRELNNLATYEVRRLAIRYSDYFSGFYDSLEQKVAEIATVTATPERPGIDLSSVLLMIAQRSRTLDPYMRQSRLRSFVDPIKAAWSSPEFVAAIDSFQSFCETLGLDRVFPYLQAVGAEAIQDWAEVSLTEQGKEIQRGMNARFNQLPIRGTKTMLAVTTDRVKPTEPAHEIACELWRDAIPLILPTVLKLVKNAHAFHNPQSFAGSPDYVRPLIVRVLTDRFWQAGISTGSKEEFYARVASSKDTLEGFSSATRGKVRAVRECCYSIIYSMSRLGAHFYAYEELAGPLAEALFRDAPHLSSHQFSVLLNVTRCIIDDCPARYRAHFLPPMISTLFAQIDKKLTSEWDSVERRKAGAAETGGSQGNASLTDEMKDESVLRQLTYSAVMEVANFLDPHRQDNGASTAETEQQQQQEQPESPPAKPDSIRRWRGQRVPRLPRSGRRLRLRLRLRWGRGG